MGKRLSQEKGARWIRETIRGFLAGSPHNSLGKEIQERAWAEPLIGFSNGADPLFEEFKEKIGDFYWTPLDLFSRAFPEAKTSPDQLTVISWILPQTERTKKSNRSETVYPSENWARARIFGEAGNVKLRQAVVEVLKTHGYRAVAPQLDPTWQERNSERYGDASTWSERHAAYASGLGTFGLCDGLITAKGKAVRCGSVVVDITIPPTKRPYTDSHEYCLFHSDGLCGKCMRRCPVSAIGEMGHHKGRCRDHIFNRTSKYVLSNFHFQGYACGLCQVGVPCESRIPTPSDL